MRRRTTAFILAITAISLAGCNGETTADSATTTTTMDAVDVVQGTISDEMIASDAITEQAPTAEGDEDDTASKKGDDSKFASDKKAKPKAPSGPVAPTAPISAQPSADVKPQ
jgi:hypothetical protein